jgi:beta-1,4-mannosyl-glycoprotein beta-1,4-N-acetylglucosaminyltransferase
LRNIKAKNYPLWRLDLFFSNKKHTDLFFVNNGGWHFTYLKTPEQLYKKLINFAHHFEFEKSGLNIKDIKRLINEKKIIYDHGIDQKKYKWSGNKKLNKVDNTYLPKYITSNLDKYKDWLDLT